MDRDLENFATIRFIKKLTVIEQDVMRFDFQQLARQADKPLQNFRQFAYNIPTR